MRPFGDGGGGVLPCSDTSYRSPLQGFTGSACFVSGIRWLPESARWLSANGRAEEAHQYIMKCAEMNNRAEHMEGITPEVHFKCSTVKKWQWLQCEDSSDTLLFLIFQILLESPQDDAPDGKYTFVDIFKTPNIRWLSIWLGILWWGTLSVKVCITRTLIQAKELSSFWAYFSVLLKSCFTFDLWSTSQFAYPQSKFCGRIVYIVNVYV